MSSLVILGAGGFLGRNLISAGPFSLPIKAVARHIQPHAVLNQEGITWIEADLLEATCLAAVLGTGDIVINLAYMACGGEADNRIMIDNIINACLSRRVARLVQCSTAVVAGGVSQARIIESLPCLPRLPYERTMWALEQRVLGAVPRGLDVVIARPTAVVGGGSRNLMKLARSLQCGNRIVSYLRASMLARRPMHLVPVRTVVTALIHLATLPGSMNGNIYHISSDEDPDNNFKAVERVLSRALGLPSRKLPLLPVPRQMLSVMFRLLGRSEISPRVYDSRKLLDTGFEPADSVASAVCDFSEKYVASVIDIPAAQSQSSVLAGSVRRRSSLSPPTIAKIRR